MISLPVAHHPGYETRSRSGASNMLDLAEAIQNSDAGRPRDWRQVGRTINDASGLSTQIFRPAARPQSRASQRRRCADLRHSLRRAANRVVRDRWSALPHGVRKPGATTRNGSVPWPCLCSLPTEGDLAMRRHPGAARVFPCSNPSGTSSSSPASEGRFRRVYERFCSRPAGGRGGARGCL